jgi:single-strand DNA-binding protein
MASVNKVILVGNLGRDPEVRQTTGGVSVCGFSLATTRNWKNRDSGERQEETEWHRVICYDRLADVAGQYLTKGRSVYVEGRLKTRTWEDKDGKDRYTTEIVVEHLQLLGARGDDDSSGSARPAPAPSPRQQREAAPAPRAPSQPARRDTGFDDFDQDIPF